MRMVQSCVKKITISVNPAVNAALARRAARESITKAGLIRRALRSAAAESLRVTPRAGGVFRGPADLAEKADEYLTDTGFGES